MSDREIMNAKKELSPDTKSHIDRWQFAIHDLADQIAPVISEQLQETIAWQTDGYDFTDELDGFSYTRFANELRTEIIKQLYDNKRN